jgi:RNA polymerase sigma-70 factor, ECF subfamily
VIGAVDERTAGGSLSDEEAVARVLAGERGLFEVLLRRYNPRVHRVIRGFLGASADIEDAMQQTWLAAYAALPGFRRASGFATWLLRIAANEALMRRRRAGRLSSDEDAVMNEPAKGKNPEAFASNLELSRALERAIDQLPPLYRPVFVLRELEGMDTADCAGALGLSEEAVKQRLHRARRVLRAHLDDQLGAAARQAFLVAGERCDRVTREVMAAILREPGR